MLDYELSHEIARELGLEVSLCWANSVRTLRSRKYGKGLTYIEGWAVTNFKAAIEHGWLELEDGTILDPTYTLTNSANDARWVYVPGVRYTREDLKGVRLSQLPAVWRTKGSWAKNETYWAAHVKAWAMCGVHRDIQMTNSESQTYALALALARVWTGDEELSDVYGLKIRKVV